MMRAVSIGVAGTGPEAILAVDVCIEDKSRRMVCEAPLSLTGGSTIFSVERALVTAAGSMRIV